MEDIVSIFKFTALILRNKNYCKYFYISLIDTIKIISIVNLDKKKLSYMEYSKQ